MASSDDECENILNYVSEYYFIIDEDEWVSFAKLPIIWDKDETHDGRREEIFLRGKTDDGVREFYEQVTAWKFDLSSRKPEIYVLSVEGNWVKLLKPRKAFEATVRSVLITVHLLHFVKRNPQQSSKELWNHLMKTFSMFEIRPSEVDVLENIVHKALTRIESLATSKILAKFIKGMPWKRKDISKDFKPSFIVDTTFENENQESNEMDGNKSNDDDDDFFDHVCSICDNGGFLHRCEGKCMRSFHASVRCIGADESYCASLGFTNDDIEALKNIDFYCENCKNGQHQCFSCGELGYSDSPGTQVFCCMSGSCELFYHPKCVAKIFHPTNEHEAQNMSIKIASGEEFACPTHNCYKCGGLEVWGHQQLGFAICRRCPRAYHIKCLPREIIFEKDVVKGSGIIPRAWKGLLSKRILIYCLNHAVDPNTNTPVRNHIKFPGHERKYKEQPIVEDRLKRKCFIFDDVETKGSFARPSRCIKNMSFNSKEGDPCKRVVEILSTQSHKKIKVNLNGYSLGKSSRPNTFEDNMSREDRMSKLFRGPSSKSIKSCWSEGVNEHEESEPIDDATQVTLTPDARNRLLYLMESASSSITLEEVKWRYKAPSTHAHSSKFVAGYVTIRKVESYVKAVRGAMEKLNNGGKVSDAKRVCGNDILMLLTKWKEKLEMYLAPVLYGQQYTSFGRHFTKSEKLIKIVHRLHWYIKDDDMIVDFCCGSNDFSRLMGEKLRQKGKRCYFRNYDIIQAKYDFYFERRDWMKVEPRELPTGTRLIMGLSPPFGYNATLADKFITKALDFNPKLLILIIPQEMQSLYEKKFPYDLIWKDDQMLLGKPFYLPGSVDINDKRIDDCNVKGYLLSLWSHPGWTRQHKMIAKQHGHLSGAQNYQLENTQPNTQDLNNTKKMKIDLDEVFRAHKSNMVSRQPISRAGCQSAGLGFARGRYCGNSQNNSSGWID